MANTNRIYEWSPIAHMNACKALKPASGGSFQKQSVSRRPDPEKGSWERLVAVTQVKWQSATGDALESFRFTVNGQTWEVF